MLLRLRTETRAEHDAIESALGLMDNQLTRDQYGRRLEQFYGFYRPLEERLLDCRAAFEPWLDIAERLKAPLLLADLEALGRAPGASLPLCTSLPNLDGPPECFGCLYVLEGATLGGQLISRHMAQQLNITPSAGGRFFDGYGPRTVRMWQEFRRAATEFSRTAGGDAPDIDGRAVAAARLTFVSLREWCVRDSAR